MRRRRLLAALATGIASATAGCGYAYGGGDVRDSATVGGMGVLAGDRYYAIEGSRIATASSGRQWVHDDSGDASFVDATTVSVSTRDGEGLWTYTHRESSVALALDERAYLLDDAGRAVAVESARTDDRGPGPSHETDEAWSVGLEDPEPPIAADERGVYVSRGEALVAVRDGTTTWERGLPAPVESLLVTRERVLAATREATVAIGASGEERWRVETDGPASLAAADGRTVLRGRHSGSVGDGDVAVVRTGSGERLWSATVGGSGERPAATGEAVYFDAGRAVEVYDAETGDQRWIADGVRADPPLIAVPQGVYSVLDSCEVVAIDADGERWRRDLERGHCSVVDGWIDGETVAFLFASGDVTWLQRTDQDPGLL